MARPKGTTTKSKKKTKPTDWKFNIGDKAIYRGSLYEEYQDTIITIQGRLRGKIKEYYKILGYDNLSVEVTGELLEKIEQL